MATDVANMPLSFREYFATLEAFGLTLDRALESLLESNERLTREQWAELTRRVMEEAAFNVTIPLVIAGASAYMVANSRVPGVKRLPVSQRDFILNKAREVNTLRVEPLVSEYTKGVRTAESTVANLKTVGRTAISETDAATRSEVLREVRHERGREVREIREFVENERGISNPENDFLLSEEQVEAWEEAVASGDEGVPYFDENPQDFFDEGFDHVTIALSPTACSFCVTLFGDLSLSLEAASSWKPAHDNCKCIPITP